MDEKVDSVEAFILLGLTMYFGSRSRVILYERRDSTEKNRDILLSVFLLKPVRNLQLLILVQR
jgi:hypothetical protein